MRRNKCWGSREIKGRGIRRNKKKEEEVGKTRKMRGSCESEGKLGECK